MKTHMILVVVIVFASSIASAGDYWPIGMDATYTYVNDAGYVLEVEYSQFGGRVSRYGVSGTSFAYQVTDYMSEDENGDVYLLYTEGYGNGAIDPDYWRDLGTEFKVVDLPLDTGNSWTAYKATSCCYSPCTAILGFQVDGASEVTVPAGTFSVVEVSVVNISSFCMTYPISGGMALDREIGPVILPGGYKLVSVDGAVGIETGSWGSVKALYR